MVAAKQLSLAALLWLGLANQGLALGIDEATNDLTLMERSPALKAPMAKVITAGHPASGPIHRLRDEEEELDTRDEDELDERDFEELDERDLDIETRRERPGHGPSHGPKKHRRDLEESDLETRSPRRAVPGGTCGSWGGQNGPRPRGIETRRPRFQEVVVVLVLSIALAHILDVILRTLSLKPAALRFQVVVADLVLSTALALILDVILRTLSLKPAALRFPVVVAALLLVLSAP
uniref:Uncharacterized protein n=1 Tax=Bionectria ochroleuca TaxID=29856 RepID=A0A8H7MZD9_BIOOC